MVLLLLLFRHRHLRLSPCRRARLKRDETSESIEVTRVVRLRPSGARKKALLLRTVRRRGVSERKRLRIKHQETAREEEDRDQDGV